MTAYYNEFDPYAAKWLRNLIDAGHIAKGEVDERSITDVNADDLKGFTQCHFFAGIGGWSLAARLAGWSDDRPLWTGSCPCQPFSVAGKGKGQDDERHLWPVFFDLIKARRPPVVMGEQVAAAVGKSWLDGVFTDLESIDYATGAAVVPACAVNAPHRRDRLWFVADANGNKQGKVGGDATEVRELPERERTEHCATLSLRGSQARNNDVADTDNTRPQGYGRSVGQHDTQGRQEQDGHSAEDSFWHGAEYITGPDGKARRIEPSICLLLDGVPEGLARLRAIQIRGLEEVGKYGNANERNTGEVLRMVRNAVREEACWQEPSARMRLQLPAPQVLLGFMLCLQSACEDEDARSLKKGLNEAELGLLRGLRQYDRDRGTSCGREPTEQYDGKFTDALLALSFVLARYAEAYRKEAISTHASSNRVGMLKAYGNAIVPQVAAEIIKSYMEKRP